MKSKEDADFEILYLQNIDKLKKCQVENEILKDKIDFLLDKFSFTVEELEEEIYLKNLSDTQFSRMDEIHKTVNRFSPTIDKINLFLSIFEGRDDVCAVRWESVKSGKTGYSPYCKNEWDYNLCEKIKGLKCSDCKNQNFHILDDSTVNLHFRGKKVIGIYPIRNGNLCKFIVIDLDDENYLEEAKIILKTFKRYFVSAYLERSRSGNGAHIWIFFQKWIDAGKARKFITLILEKAMEESDLVTFSSYDRLLPNQDFVKGRGFGNLIALPLQGNAVKKSNTVFLDENFRPYLDQWEVLKSIKRVNEGFIDKFIEKYGKSIFDIKLEKSVSKNDFKTCLKIKISDGIYISKEAVSSKAILFFRRLASYYNPEFFSKQAIGMSTFKTPKVMVLYEEDEENIILPKALFEKLSMTLEKLGIEYSLYYDESSGAFIDVFFSGKLREEQKLAFDNLIAYKNGILCAIPGFGKTVVAARLICEIKRSTLILVHTKELAKQWRERLFEFIDIRYDAIEVGKRKKSVFIGGIGAKGKALTSKIDILTMQSMFEKDKSVKDIVDNYGLIIVDECHHISSSTFRKIMRRVKSEYIYGLTATLHRKDGHHPIIKMYCGDIRYEKTVKDIRKNSKYQKNIIPRFTPCRKPAHMLGEKFSFQKISSFICENDLRNNMIVDDIRKLMTEGRKIMVLTDRISHLDKLVELLNDEFNLIALHGSLIYKERKESLDKINKLDKNSEVLILSIGKLVGEGFDVPLLDTLILASPISWKGRIIQYVGRLHRISENKSELRLIDYVDIHFPMLERMYFKRLKTYKSMGYSLINEIYDVKLGDRVFFDNAYLDFLLDDIENCVKSLVISIPFIKKKIFDKFKGKIFDAYKRGVNVIIAIKPIYEYPEKYRKYMQNLTKVLEDEGLTILNKESNEYKFAIIDDKLVWIGESKSAVMRVFSDELVNGLNAVLD